MAKTFPPADDAEIDALPKELAAALRADPIALAIFRSEWPNQRKSHATWVRQSTSSKGQAKRAREVITTLHLRAVARQREQQIVVAQKSALQTARCVSPVTSPRS